MIVLMIWGGYKQISNLKKNDIPLDSPLIRFERQTGPNGQIYAKNVHINTMKYEQKLRILYAIAYSNHATASKAQKIK